METVVDVERGGLPARSAKGERVDLGTVICLEVSPSVRYLARCERVLNNTSWRKLGDGCPSAGLCLPETERRQSFRTG